jgi:hypothetical protein
VLAADTERASLLDDERRLSKHIDAHPDDTEANKELAQVGLCEMCNVMYCHLIECHKELAQVGLCEM